MYTLTAPQTCQAPAAQPDFEARLAARDAAMTLRLEEAALAHAVNTAHLPTVEVDFPHLPVDTAPTAEEDGAGPVAALLRRAQQRILRDGWCRDAARGGHGGVCLAGAIRAEARSHRDEGEARVLLRRALGGGDPISEANRRLRSAHEAAQVLGRAAALAGRSGL